LRASARDEGEGTKGERKTQIAVDQFFYAILCSGRGNKKGRWEKSCATPLVLKETRGNNGGAGKGKKVALPALYVEEMGTGGKTEARACGR